MSQIPDPLTEVRALIDASIAVKRQLLHDDALLRQIVQLGQSCLEALRGGGKIIFAGNGGSLADSQHLSAEFTCRFMFDRTPLASVALGVNSSAMSAIGNDYGYDQVFARELRAIARKPDVFVPISTSGNSPNILAAIEVARELGITTVGLTGAGGGKMKALCDCICAPSRDTARIQESHILIGHIVCGVAESGYFARQTPT